MAGTLAHLPNWSELVPCSLVASQLGTACRLTQQLPASQIGVMGILTPGSGTPQHMLDFSVYGAKHHSFNLSANLDLLYPRAPTEDIDLSSPGRGTTPSGYGPARPFPSPGRWFNDAFWLRSSICPESLSCQQPTGCA
jgi:hypothetical protein